ncbi:MAG: hypothetical protein A2042_09640 [Candidatus Schekmanbacteria bacterium GWA2_38_11]|uniref:Uncharacterized protein n=1 Tax=Candidatus Schekmanbacteria bacterium GWA2_38_11 TaxID=1817876 RepID=A0A1F7RH28_9BACT|nr:MAG: hypothetical protein A2042_09640 [Candidatus Schekmanbacteria bacterium GWA2_38_11]
MSDNGWINCSSAHKWGVLYMETKVSDPEKLIFVNVRSQAGTCHVGEISLFKDDLSYDGGKENWGHLLKYGWRVPLGDYIDIMQDQEDGIYLHSWTDLTKASGRGKTRIQQLINCGSLDEIKRDGPAIISSKPLETLVKDIEDITRTGKIKRSENWKFRWDNTNTNSGKEL